MATRHGVFADDSTTFCVVVPKDVKERVNRLGNTSGRIRKYIVDGLIKDEKKIGHEKKE